MVPAVAGTHRCRTRRRPSAWTARRCLDDVSDDEAAGGRAILVLILVLFVPPWISRAAVYLSSRRAAAGAESGTSAALAGTSAREMAEIIAMSILQDCVVASFAFGLLLPTVMLVVPKRGRFASSASKIVAGTAGVVVYALFAAPVWLDLLSQLLTGVRMRADFVVMMVGNLGMFSSSFAAFLSNLLDLRALVILIALVSCGNYFVGAVLTLSRRRRSLTCALPIRRCARPMVYLAGMHILFLIAVMSSLMVSRTSISCALQASNVVFIISSEAVGLSYLEPDAGFLLSDSIPSSPGEGTRPSFIFKSERFTDRDTTGRYPFYRRTTGFVGPKAFEIDAARRRPNVVLIMMETWRHMDVGVLGGSVRKRERNRTATPNFDRLASENVLFGNFFANGVQTSRTIISSLFGTLPQFTTSAAVDSPSAPSLVMSGLPSLLKSMGYTTQFMSATGLDWQGWDTFLPAHGFDNMFGLSSFADRFEELQERDHNSTFGTFEEDSRETDDYSDRFRNYDENSWGMADSDGFLILADEMSRLSRSEKKPFFVDFYSISSHHPFEVPPSFDAPDWIREEAGDNDDYRKYLEALSYSDQALGDFFERMKELNLMNNTVFFVSGDHGFGFCEHKPCFDGMNIGNANSKVYDEVSRVPMMIVSSMPESSRGTVINEAASQVDFMSTVMDILGVAKDGFLQHGIGRSLMRKLPQSMGVAVLQNTFNDMAMGMKVGEMKYVFEGSRDISVYNFTQDPHESTPLYHKRMKKSNDPLEGAPRGILQVRDKVAKLLHDTTRCFHSNTFMPPSQSDETKGQDRSGEAIVQLGNETGEGFSWRDWTWSTDLNDEEKDPAKEFDDDDMIDDDRSGRGYQVDGFTAFDSDEVKGRLTNTHEHSQNNNNATADMMQKQLNERKAAEKKGRSANNTHLAHTKEQRHGHGTDMNVKRRHIRG